VKIDILLLQPVCSFENDLSCRRGVKNGYFLKVRPKAVMSLTHKYFRQFPNFSLGQVHSIKLRPERCITRKSLEFASEQVLNPLDF